MTSQSRQAQKHWVFYEEMKELTMGILCWIYEVDLISAVFTVNIKLCRKWWKWPFSTRKITGKLNKTISKLSAALNSVNKHLSHEKVYDNNFIATNGLPRNSEMKGDDNDWCNACSMTTHQADKQRKQSSAMSDCARRSALGAEDDSTPHANSLPNDNVEGNKLLTEESSGVARAARVNEFKCL